MIDGSHGPCDTNTKEDIDSIGTGNVTNGCISSFILDGSCFTGKGVWNTCAQSNKSDSIDGIFEVNEASEMASNITNDSGTDTDHGNGDNEAWISSTQSSGRNSSENDFPEKCQKVHDIISTGWHLFFSFLFIIISCLNSESFKELIFP